MSKKIFLITDQAGPGSFDNDGSVYVYFGAIDPKERQHKKPSVFHYSDFLSIEDHRLVAKEFEKHLTSLERKYGYPARKAFGFSLSFLLYPVLFWEKALERIFSSGDYSLAYISSEIVHEGKFTVGSDLFGRSRDMLSRWSLDQAIKRYLLVNEINCLEYKPVVKPSNGHQNRIGREFLRTRLEKAVNHIFQALETIPYEIRLKQIDILKNKDLACNLRSILVCAQQSKMRRLSQILKIRGLSFRNIEPDGLVNAIQSHSGQKSKPFTYDLSFTAITDPKEEISSLIDSLNIYYLQNIIPNLFSYLRQFNGQFITDAVHHPVVHFLSDCIRRTKGWHISLLPEGGVNAYAQPYNERELIYVEPHRNLTQYASSFDVAYSLEDIGSKLDSIILLGYDTTLHLSKMGGKLLRFLLRVYSLIVKGEKIKRIIFLEPGFVPLKDFGIVRPSHISSAHLIDETIQLESILDKPGTLVIGNCRNKKFFKSLRIQRLYHSSLHWSIIMHCADLLVIRDSSIGIETLAHIRKPVLSWCPSGISYNFYSRIHDFKAEYFSFRYVTDEQYLESEVENLLRHAKRTDDFSYFLDNVPIDNLEVF